MRDRGSSYVESPQRLECEFQKRLALTASQLDEQRARIKREADVRRVGRSCCGGQKYSFVSRPLTYSM